MHSLMYLSASPFPIKTPLPAPSIPMNFPFTFQASSAVSCAPAVYRHSPTTTSLSNQHVFFNVMDAPYVISSYAWDNVNQAIQSGWAELMMKRYAGTIKQFIHFCDEEQVPEHLCFLANKFVLCAFAASSLSKHASSTPHSRLSALKAWHLAHNLNWNGSI